MKIMPSIEFEKLMRKRWQATCQILDSIYNLALDEEVDVLELWKCAIEQLNVVGGENWSYDRR